MTSVKPNEATHWRCNLCAYTAQNDPDLDLPECPRTTSGAHNSVWLMHDEATKKGTS